jgi:hypothetical protein
MYGLHEFIQVLGKCEHGWEGNIEMGFKGIGE